MADAKISALTDGSYPASGDLLVLARAGADYKLGATRAGLLELVYKYTVAGSDKASIDTGADTADAGSGDWTNGDVLEVYLVARTDDAAGVANLDWTLNNDAASAHYDVQYVYAVGTTVAGAQSLGQNKAAITVHGAGGTASYPGICELVIPNFTGTTFNKVGRMNVAIGDSTSAANHYVMDFTIGFLSTAAVTRLKVAAQGTAKLKIGTQLLIYKRRSF